MGQGFFTLDPHLNGETQDADFPFKASFTKREFLGKGRFGYVYKQYDELSNRYMACKEVDLHVVTGTDYEKKFETAMKEVRAMKRLDHIHIVEYYGHSVTTHPHRPETRILCIYMEYATGGSVRDRLNKEGAFNETRAKRYTWQMLLGVSYLHKQHVIHRDLKCCNMLLDSNDNIKLADLGISRECHSTQESKRSRYTDTCGTAHYMAPEVMAGEKYGRKADIWSAGATVVEMLTTQPPWYKLTDYQVMYNITLKKKPEYVLNFGATIKVRSFLDVIFNYDSQKRPSAEELLEHDWFSGFIKGV